MIGISPKAGGGGASKRHIVHDGTFKSIISLENLFTAWREFRQGKRQKPDIQEFEFRLEDNIFNLHQDLINGTYQHGPYQQFYITDPKVRLISKATVRDRLLHHAIYRVLYPLFDTTFIFDSYSCRVGKGTHKAFKRLMRISRKVSRNYTGPCWSLKMDIKKFFDTVDHAILYELLRKRISDSRLLDLLMMIINSFEAKSGRGMPIGNLISQLFVNIYLDPLDKFVKHQLKAQYYLRYADDFMVLGSNYHELLTCFLEMNTFLIKRLKLTVHPNKIHLRKLNWGIDFVGYVALSHYSIPRGKTVKRIMRKVKVICKPESLQSYLGYFQHVSGYRLSSGLAKLLESGRRPLSKTEIGK